MVEEDSAHTEISVLKENHYLYLLKFIYFHYIIHMKHDAVISFLLNTFQETILCQNFTWKFKTTVNLTKMWSTKIGFVVKSKKKYN